jgi:hypothetical protein
VVAGAVPRGPRGARAVAGRAAAARAGPRRTPALARRERRPRAVGPPSSSAATITYDLSGTSAYRTYTAFAPNGYFETPLSPGSTLTLELDANGDGTANDATVVASRFLVREIFPAFGGAEDAYGQGVGLTLTSDLVFEVSGGLGVPYGGDAWIPPHIEWLEPASFSASGTFRCSGPGCMNVLLLAEGVDHPYSELLRFLGAVPVSAVHLAMWAFDWDDPTAIERTCDSVHGRTCAEMFPVTTLSYVPYEPVSVLSIRGRAVPEPGTLLLSALGPLALALRRFA